jgi:protein kinase
MFRIVSVLGAPSPSNWPEGMKYVQKIGLRFPTIIPTGLAPSCPTASRDAVDFMTKMLTLDPHLRPSAKKALSLPFMTGPRMTLGEFEAIKSPGRRSQVPPPIIIPGSDIVRPHAAPITPVQRHRMSVSFSQESLSNLIKAELARVSERPIDYRQYEVSQDSDDDLFNI